MDRKLIVDIPRHVYQMCLMCEMGMHDLCPGRVESEIYAADCECGDNGHGVEDG